MKRDGTRDFHEARWDEPILMELGEPGQRALLLEEIEPQVAQAAVRLTTWCPRATSAGKPPSCRSWVKCSCCGTICACPKRPSARTSTSTSAWAPAP